ncbi:BrnT family toxin [Paludibacterium purpuratum]|uniref:Uncharacterized protein n=1 Tax=Paludibacterium purpuratum TaxID=1144873 RepID=A0A4R7AY58_9NEIS|nr:BrnT family toxin [Paludibacterium purpuratum]TDR71639.1 hypothetical protein DFP86_11850 [Paludibacterium purpuratum]
MMITYDVAKSATNITKHGISLAEATNIEWDTLWAFEDTRRNYGEVRIIGYAYIGLRLFNVVFVDRDEVRRIISLRKANNREIKNYAEA